MAKRTVAIETDTDLRGDVREQERLVHGFLRLPSQKHAAPRWRHSFLVLTCDRFASAAGTLQDEYQGIRVGMACM